MTPRRLRRPLLRYGDPQGWKGNGEGLLPFYHALAQRRTRGEKTLFLGDACTGADEIAKLQAEDMARKPTEFPGAAAELIMAQTMHDLQAQNIVPDMWAAQNLMAGAWRQAFEQVDTTSARVRIAKDRARAMERVIDDQLRECNANGQRRPSWQQNCRAVVKPACLYGMGVLKGPLVEKVQTKRHICQKDRLGCLAWREEVFSEDLRPYHEAVSIWDVFPDPDARNPGELRFVWQSHLMTDKDVIALKSFPGFDAATIEAYLHEHEEGDDWQSPAREMKEIGPLPQGAVTRQPEKPAPTLEEAKAAKLDEIDSQTSAAILAGFDYTVNGENLHFSYDGFDQQNFADTANACLLAQSGVAGLPENVTWNAYRGEARELVRLTLTAAQFLELYTAGALAHKAAVEVAQTRDALREI